MVTALDAILEKELEKMDVGRRVGSDSEGVVTMWSLGIFMNERTWTFKDAIPEFLCRDRLRARPSFSYFSYNASNSTL